MEFKKIKLILIVAVIGLIFTIPSQAASTQGRFFLKVVNVDDKPIAGAKVTLISTESKDKIYTLETEDNGKTHIIGIDPDLYELTIEKEGYQNKEGTVKLRPGVKVKLEEEMLTIPQAKATAKAKAWENLTTEEQEKYEAGDAAKAGLDAYNNNNMELAETKLKEAIAINEDVGFSAYLVLGQIAFNKKDFESAVKYLEKARELDIEEANFSDIRRLLGASYLSLEKLDEAKAVWIETVEEQPDPVLMCEIAKIEHRQDNKTSAIEWLKKCTDKFPEDAESLNMLGLLYVNTDNYPGALDAYSKLLKVMEGQENADQAKIDEIKSYIAVFEEEIGKKK